MRAPVIALLLLAFAAAASAAVVRSEILEQSKTDIAVIIKADERAEGLIKSLTSEYEEHDNDFYAAKIRKDALDEIEANPYVADVWLDKLNYPLLDISVPLIGAADAWTSYNGSSIKVCVIDTGVNKTHPALAGRIAGEQDFVVNDSDSNDTSDYHGHGTHVAGIVASSDATYRGVAPGSSILNAKVFFKFGNSWVARDSDIMAGIDWCIAQGAHVLTLSLGGFSAEGDGSDALSQYLDYAAEQGKIVTVSAGNSGPDGDGDCRASGVGDSFSICKPGLSHSAITVGSSKTSKGGTTDEISGFSSRGPTADGRIKPDLVAPGQVIKSLAGNSSFAEASGTSMSAPHVAGIAALALQARPAMSSEEFKALLMNSANGNEKNNVYGAGRVNVTRLFSEINNTLTASIKNFSRAHNLFVAGGEIRATLYWPENYSNHSNLDLLLYNPSGILKNASLSVDNTDEKIVFGGAEIGWWKLVVNGTEANAAQKYAITANAPLSGQLFFFPAAASNATYHEMNITNESAEIYVDFLNGAVNASVYNSSGLFVLSSLNDTRINLSFNAGGLLTLKISANRSANYSVTANNEILNAISYSKTRINITKPADGSYVTAANFDASFIVGQRTRIAQSCSVNNGTSEAVMLLLPGSYSLALNFSDGSHKINVTCTDDEGATSSTTNFVVDTAAPDVTITAADNNDAYVPRNHTFINLSVSEAQFNCTLEWNKINESMRSSGSACFANKTAADGTHNYSVFVNDSAGNIFALSRNITFDIAVPQASAVFSGGLGNMFSPNDDGVYDEITFNVTATEKINFSTTYMVAENGTRVKTFQKVDSTLSIKKTWNGCFIDACTSGVVPDGSYKIEIRMTDRAGNFNATNISEITVDSAALRVSFAGPTPNNATIAKNFVTINVTTSKSAVNVTLEWNDTNESMTGNSGSWIATKMNLSDGKYFFVAYANDSFGNINASERRFVVVNTTRNVTAWLNETNQSLAEKNVTIIIYNSTGAAVNSTIIAYENYTVRFNASSVIAEADFAGEAFNTSAAVNVTKNITGQQNINTAFAGAGGALDNYVWIDFGGLASNYTARVAFQKNYAVYFYLSGNSDSPSATRITNVCNATNTNTPCYNSSGTLFLQSFSGAAAGSDTQAPSLSVTSPANTTYNSSSISVTYTVSDNVGVSICSYSLNRGSNTTLSSCGNTTVNAGQGANSIVVYASDASGNIGQASVSFTYKETQQSSSSSSSSSSGGSTPPAAPPPAPPPASKPPAPNNITSTVPPAPQNITGNETGNQTGNQTAPAGLTGFAFLSPANAVIGAAVVIAALLLYFGVKKGILKKILSKKSSRNAAKRPAPTEKKKPENKKRRREEEEEDDFFPF